MWLIKMNKLMSSFKVCIDIKVLALCLMPMTLMLSTNVKASSAEDSGLVNHRLDVESVLWDLTDYQCKNIPKTLSDVDFTIIPDGKYIANDFSLRGHEGDNCDEYFADFFAGDVYIPASEDITFYLNSDDGSKLWIDGNLIVNNDGIHGEQESYGTVNLTQGWHYIEVKYFNGGGSYKLSVSYNSATLSGKKEIPNAALRLGGAFDTDSDGTTNYYDNDDDNDGFSDIDEEANGTSTIDVNDKPANDVDGDFVSDLIDIDNDGDNLIEISSIAQLDLMRFDLSGTSLNGITTGCVSCIGYELINDLDFDTNQDGVLDANDSHWNDGKGFMPIGKDTGIFTGTFDGNGFQIKNLLIRLTSGYSGGVGLFRDLGPSSEVRNLVFSGTLGEIRGRDGVGTLAGLSGGTIEKVSVNRAVTGINYAGGIVGMMYSGKLNQVHFEGHVTGDEDVGGLIGDGFGGAVIYQAYSRAMVTGSNRIGAIAGTADIIAAAVYWDSDIEAVGAGRVLTSDASTTKTTKALKCPTSTSDNNCSPSLYSSWSRSDWHFGTNTQLPVLAWSSLYYRDTDGDGIYDAQDLDDDNDGVLDDSDALPFDNSEFLDTDLDGIGNNADTDDDNDGYSDIDESANGTNPLLASSMPSDDDADFISNLNDNCPSHFNSAQENIDADGLGDVCDDSDSDSITDAEELFAGTDINNANHRPYWWKSVTAQLGESVMFSLQVSEAGDVNKDGFDDVIIGARSGENSQGITSGVAQVISGKTGTLLYQFEGQNSGDFYGASVSSAGDVNKDGFADLIVGAYKNDNTGNAAGAAYVYSGIDGTLLYQFQGETAYQYFGRAVSGAGDVNDDGYDDVIVGAPWDKYNWGSGLSHVYVYSGIDGALIHRIDGFNDFDQLGLKVSELADVNNDGKDDFLVGSKHHNADGDPQGNSTGVVRLYNGADGTVIFSLYGEEVSDRFPHSIKPTTDYNQDNIADFIVGTQGSASKVYVFSGADGEILKEFTGESSTSFGGAASGLGDVNNDGIDDLVIGASYTNSGHGAAHVYSGKDNSELFVFHGEYENSLGQSVSTAGDLDNDGQDDIIVSSHGYDNYAGMARLILSKDIQNDNDLDYWINSSDNCTDVANSDQLNSDADSYGDACDAFINDATEWLDTDGDDVGNNADLDDDNDGVNDDLDAFPLDATESTDNDGDGTGNNADNDDDNDGYLDTKDSSPFNPLLPGLQPIRQQSADNADNRFAYSIANVGDVDGDGVNDIVTGAFEDSANGFDDNGVVFVISAKTGKVLYKIYGDGTDNELGKYIRSAPDMDNDNVSDFLVYRAGKEADTNNAIELYSSKTGSLIYSISTEHDVFGHDFTFIDDLNNDAVADLLISAPGFDNAETNTGAVFIYSGIDGSELSRIEGNGGYFGAQLVPIGDINADEITDFIVSAYNFDGISGEEGRIYALSGADNKVLYQIDGNEYRQQIGKELVTIDDINNDGIKDFAYSNNTTAEFQGEQRGFISLASGADGSQIKQISADSFGFSDFGKYLYSVRDIDGDGSNELVIVDSGAINDVDITDVVFYSLSKNKVIGRIYSDTFFSGRSFGKTLAVIDDITGDNFPEIVIGDYGHQGQASSTGAMSTYSLRDIIADTDGDGTVDGNDSDIDNDGVININDVYPYISLAGLEDADNDGIPNSCDSQCQLKGMVVDDYINGVIYVDSNSSCNAQNETCGRDWLTAFRTLQDALLTANPNQQIWVSQGVYYPSDIDNNPYQTKYITFKLPTNVSIFGGFNAVDFPTQLSEANPEQFKTVLSGDIDFKTNPDVTDDQGITQNVSDIIGNNASTLIFTALDSQDYTISGVTLTGTDRMNSSQYALNVSHGNATITQVDIIGSKSSMRLNINENCQININHINLVNIATSSPFIKIFDTRCSQVTISDLTTSNSVTSDTVIDIRNVDSNIELNRLSIVNDTPSEGGILYSNSDYQHLSVTVNDSVFFNLHSIHSQNILNVNNSIFMQTHGIKQSEDFPLTVKHSSFINNNSSNDAGAISSASTNNNLGANLFVGNTGTKADNIYVVNNINDLGYNLVGDNNFDGFVSQAGLSFVQAFDSATSFTSAATIEQITEQTLVDNGGDILTTLPISQGPAVDVIPEGDCQPEFDIRGVSRPQESLCDIGAVELSISDQDTDGDGVDDGSDAFPLDANETTDTDGDGVGNNADVDDDGDGYPDVGDDFPLNSLEWADTDGDSIGNNADTDDDNDGYLDVSDDFPLDNTEWLDTDGDGTGNNTDGDDDGDGIPDEQDGSPLDDKIGDIAAPIIHLIGNSSINLMLNQSYVEPGFSALDNVDGDLSGSVEVSGTVDSSIVGTYIISYNVSDAASNQAITKTRQVTIQDVSAPVVIAPNNIIIAAIDALGTPISNTEINAFLMSANANDDVDGNVSVVYDAPDMFALGVTTVYFTAIDSANNVGSAQATVTVVDQSIPVITLLGNTSVILSVNDTYNEPGYHALDNVDGDITASIIVVGTVDISTVGTYTLTYSASDSVGNAAQTKTRQVTVQDAQAPVIIAPNNITVAATDVNGTLASQGSISVFLASANGSDDVDDSVTVSNDAPSIFPIGTTVVVFSAQDAAGNVGSAQASVTVIDQTSPIINLLGNTSLTLSVNDSYVELGFSANDNVDGDLFANVVVAGSVDTSTIGIYTLSYNVSDSTGNAAQTKTRQVTVQDAQAPVIIAPNNITVAATDVNGTAANQGSISAFLASANGSDDVDDSVTVTNDAPSIFPLGTTVVVFSAQDAAGNVGSAQASVTVIDQTSPVINLLGNTSLTLSINGSYIEPGFSANDNVDGDLTGNVVLTGAVNIESVGIYTLTYDVVDSTGNKAATKTRQVTVQDVSAPVVIAANNIVVAAVDASGTPIEDSSISNFLNTTNATDDVDGVIAVSHDAPDVFPIGVTTVVFTATDNAGNVGNVQATVTVIDQSVPVLLLQGNTSIILNVGDTFVEPGFSALDNVDGDLTDNIVVIGAVNTESVGTYTLTYDVSDTAGNKATTQTRKVTVQDVFSPIVVTANNLVVAAVDASGTSSDDSSISNFLSSANATDDVDGVIVVSHNAPDTFPIGVTTVVFTATDSAGNVGNAQATVTVVDQSVPVLLLQGNSLVTLNIGDAFVEPGFSALDNVDGDLTDKVVVTGTVNTESVATYTITYDVVDTAGNKAVTQSRQITVLDVSAPNVKVANNIVVAAVDASGTPIENSSISNFLNGAIATDNVDGVIAVSHDAPDVFPLGITTVVFSSTDSAGNSGSAQAAVTIVDQSQPVINLIGNTSIILSVNDKFSEPGYTVIDNVDGDISQLVSITGDVDSSTVGIYTLGYNVSDAAGNAADTKTRQVTVQDVDAPVVIAPNNIVVAAVDAFGTSIANSSVSSFLNSANATDYVDGVIAVNNDAPDVFPLGITTVTFSATDSAGNIGSAQAMVTIADQTKPVINLIGNTSMTLSVNELFEEPGFTGLDNVDGDIEQLVTITGDVDSSVVGTYTLSYDVKDIAGNVADTKTRQVTVQDAAAPVIIAPNNITVAATDDNGTPASNAAVAAFLASANASDDVDAMVVVLNNAPDIFPLGTTVVTFTAQDAAGNTGTAQASLLVADQSQPVITLVGNTSITLSVNEVFEEPGFSAFDNVDGDISQDVVASGGVDTSKVGTYSLTYTVSDSAGNVATVQNRQVTVQDSAAPIIISPNNIIVAAVDATGTSIENNVIQTFLTAANASDDVDSELSISNDAPSVFPLGVTKVTFSASDNAGNIGSSQAAVTVVDESKPSITLEGNTSMSLSVGDVYTELGYLAVDNVDGDITENVVIVGAVDTKVVGIYTLTYSVQDNAGNKSQIRNRQVTVQDAQAPIIAAPNNIEVAAIDALGISINHQEIDIFLKAASAIDDVDSELVITHNAPLVFAMGTTVVMFTATDSAGNVGSAQSLVSIVDETSPVITLTGETAQTIYLLDQYLEPGFSARDNVDGDISQQVIVSGAVDNTRVGVYSIHYDVSDAADNAAETLSRQVIVQDPEVADSDNDGVVDAHDAFPSDNSEWLDTDNDGEGNNADSDDDNDNVDDVFDDFPLDASESVDTDNDGIGNNADTDDDGDGILDVDDAEPLVAFVDNQAPVFAKLDQLIFEATGEVTTVVLPSPNVTDNVVELPTVTSNLSAGLTIGTHQITWTATDSSGNQSMALQTVVIKDSTAPVFTIVEAITVNAKGRLTDVYYLINAMAVDIVDSEVFITTFDNTMLPSGYHEIEIVAADMAGNESTAIVAVTIYPEATIRNSLLVESGGVYSIDVELSGTAPSYPVAIDYQLSLNGEHLEADSLIVDEGTIGELSLSIPSGLQTTDNLVLNLVEADHVFVSEKSQSQLIIVENNIAPLISFTISQSGQLVSVIDPDNGEVTLVLQISDVNASDTHTIAWTDASGTFTNAVDTLTYHIDPSSLEQGTYSFEVSVAENNTQEQLSVTRSVQFVVEQLAKLENGSDSDNDGISDSDEGYADSDGDGIADYLDNDSNTTRLPSSENAEPMQTTAGLTMSLGSLVSSQGSSSDEASLQVDDLAQLVGDDAAETKDAGVEAVTPLYNFTIDGLGQQGGSVAVVIPMAVDTYLPAGATYRKYNERDGWFTFVEDENNSVSSALTDINGNCPAANDESYVLGLTQGDNCLQLIIEDGGANDADFIVNGSVEDPGAIVIDKANNAPTVSIEGHEYSYSDDVSVTLVAQGNDVDGDEINYQWLQISGPQVTFDDATLSTVNIDLPQVIFDEVIELQVTVSDGKLSTTSLTSFRIVGLTDAESEALNERINAGTTTWLLILLTLVRLRKRVTHSLAA